LNASSGLLTAYSVSTPVLLISGQVDSSNLGKEHGDIHEVREQLDVFGPITKWCARIMSVQGIPPVVHRAMTEMRSGRPRPAEIELPADILSKKADVNLFEPSQPHREEPDAAKAREAARLLALAEHPLIWAGGGVISSDAWAELTALAEALNAPVITTHQGKGAIAENHHLSLGVYYQGQGPANWAVPKADVVLIVGSRAFFSPKLPWAFKPHQKLIQIDADKAEVGRNWPLRVGIVADAKQGLKALLVEIDGRSRSQWTSKEIASIKGATNDSFQQHAPEQMKIIHELREVLADDTVVVPGITNVGYWANLAMSVFKPRTWITVSYSATLGYELGSAIGASLGNPGKQVLAMCGDGGFMYAVAELATARQQGISLVAVVFNDNAFGASLHDQQLNFRGRVIGTKLHNPDFAALAVSFGVNGVKLKDHRHLAAAVKEALGNKGVTVIEVPIPTWVPPFLLPPAGTKSTKQYL
jgi:acetolactate synthase-1/2/3 large subunit